MVCTCGTPEDKWCKACAWLLNRAKRHLARSGREPEEQERVVQLPSPLRAQQIASCLCIAVCVSILLAAHGPFVFHLLPLRGAKPAKWKMRWSPGLAVAPFFRIFTGRVSGNQKFKKRRNSAESRDRGQRLLKGKKKLWNVFSVALYYAVFFLLCLISPKLLPAAGFSTDCLFAPILFFITLSCLRLWTCRSEATKKKCYPENKIKTWIPRGVAAGTRAAKEFLDDCTGLPSALQSVWEWRVSEENFFREGHRSAASPSSKLD